MMSHSATSAVVSIRASRLGIWLLLLLISLQIGCESSSEETAGKDEKELPTIEVDVLTVGSQPWPRIVRSQGNLVADQVAVVGSKVAGRVAEVHVDLGDFVTGGSPVVTLDKNEFELRVQQAEAQLRQARAAVGLGEDDAVENLKAENSPPVQEELAIWDEAKANLERMKRLQAQRAVTEAEVEQLAAAERVAKARYASALNSTREKIALIGIRQAELSLARQQLEDVVIRMPFDGLVQVRDIAPGAYVQIGNSVATVVRTNPLRFRGAIAERQAEGLQIGQRVVLSIELVDKPREVVVTRISPALNTMNRSLIFEADVKNEDRGLRAGLFAEAEVLIDPQAQALIVPHASVVEFAGAEKVWKVVDGQAKEQEVVTGERRDAGIEILRGLEAGDVILAEGVEGREAKVIAHPITDDTSTEPAVDSQSGLAVEEGESEKPTGDRDQNEPAVSGDVESAGGASATTPAAVETIVSE